MPRTLPSYLPRLGLIPIREANRPNGLSVMVTVKDEEDWVEKSIISVATVATEVVVVDNGSSDNTPLILARLETRMAGKLRVFRFEKEDYCAAVNFTLGQTRYKWILRCPGGFISQSAGEVADSRVTSSDL